METKPPINWLNTIVLTATPAVALIGVPWYGFTVGFDLFEWSMFALFMMMTGYSITGGYHRLWSHKTYEANFFIRLFFAIWGACSLQNSILHWSADHRNHHRFVDDNERDPYSASRGFVFSHIGWILRKYDAGKHDFSKVQDLMKDPIVVWQHKYYLPLAVITNAAIPLAIGFFHGKLWGTFLLAGMLRIVLNHHFTFFINSLAHIWGSRPYSENSSARDNGLLAFFTYGEGYHNFHHTFQHDYRNGARWYQFDPSKWAIRAFSWIGLTRRLKTVPKEKIEFARLEMQFKKAVERLERMKAEPSVRETLENRYEECKASLNEWTTARRKWYQAKKEKLAEQWEMLELKGNHKDFKTRFFQQRKQWRLCLAEHSLR